MESKNVSNLMSEGRCVYLDNAATTPVEPEVFDAMVPYFKEEYGNPSSQYGLGTRAKQAIEHAREQIADLIGCMAPENIIFTSGATESINTVMKASGAGCLIYGVVDHAAVRNIQGEINKHEICVNHNGQIIQSAFEGALADEQATESLVSLTLVNNEIGTIEDVYGLTDIATWYGAKVHCDLTQGIGKVPIDVEAIGVDYASGSGHKFGAPKGIGFLYCDALKFPKLLDGGAQENGHRAGTENVPYIVGIGKAAELAKQNMREHNKYVEELRYFMWRELMKIPGTHINGPTNLEDYDLRVGSNLNLRFDGVDGGTLQTMLAMAGICVSVGSACHAFSKEPSHVLKAIGLSDQEAMSSIRITIGHQNTMPECALAVKYITSYVEFLRNQRGMNG